MVWEEVDVTDDEAPAPKPGTSRNEGAGTGGIEIGVESAKSTSQATDSSGRVKPKSKQASLTSFFKK